MWCEVLQYYGPYVKVTAGQGAFLTVSHIFRTQKEARMPATNTTRMPNVGFKTLAFYL